MKHNYTSSNGLQETQGTKLNVNVPRNSWTDPTGEMRNEKLKMKNCYAGEVSREDAKTQSYAKQTFSTMMRSCCGHVAVRSSQSLLRYATVVLMCLFVGVGNAWGETTAAVNEVLWQEQFTGTTTSTSTTFSASNATAISGVANSSKGTSMLVTADISKIAYTASNVMLTASTGTNCSGAHIWINKSTTGYFQVTGIPLYGANKVKVSWAQGGASKITVQYSFDGSTNFTELSSNSSASAEFTSTELNTSGHTTISLKFVRTSTSTNIRLDNLKLFVTEAGANKTPLSTPAVITNIAESDITTTTTTTTTIRWGSVSGAANYELVVKQGSTEKFKKSDIAGTETSYTVTGLTASTAYMATVKALAGSSTTNSDSEVSNDVSWTTAAPAQRTITWLVNGSAWTEGSPTTSVEDGSKPSILPTEPTSADCDGSKVFVGWTAQDNVSSDERPSDLFKTVAPEITRDVTFRAVFATKVGAGQDAPTAFFEETFKAAGNSTVVFSNSNLSASQNMFVDKTADVVSHYSGVGKQSNSTNTNAGKTGSCCYSQANSASTINALTISGIDISGKSNLQLHFWCKRNGTNKSGNVIVNVTAKIDDGAVVALLTNEDRTDDANWYERTLDISGTGTSLTLSFSYTTAGGYQCLFDDIEVLGTDGGYENYTISCSCDHEFWWGYPNESGEYVCFTQVGNTNEWQTANITIPAYEWNGSKEMYYNVSNLDNNRTQNIKFYRLRFAHSADKCNVTYDGADNHTVTAEGPKPGAYGKIRMFDNYSDKNGFAAFIPNGYKLKLGSDEVELNLVANTEGKEWQTAILELTAARINNTIEAGVTDAEGGFIGVNSFGTAQTIAASNLGQKTNATTWGANLSAADAGKHGVFRIWLDHCAKNWDVHFVPYYRLNYNANGGSGEEMASTDWVSCEADDDARKVSVTACTFTAPENKRFKEWNTQADGNGTTVAVGDYTLTSETTLYAIWEDIPTYTITWQWDGGYTTTTGQINTAVETSTIPTAATCDDNIFVGWVAATYTKQATKPATIDVSELTYTANVTYHALYGLVDGVSQVTDANEIVDGGEYIFVITDNTNTYALKQGSPNYKSIHLPYAEDDAALVWKAEAQDGGSFHFTQVNGDTYHIYNSSSTTLSTNSKETAQNKSASKWFVSEIEGSNNLFKVYTKTSNGARFIGWNGATTDANKKFMAYANSNFKNQFAAPAHNLQQFDGALYIYRNSAPQAYSTSCMSLAEKCATPTFTPEGGAYYGTRSVTISCETADATIYYTTDGSTPTTSSNVYSSAIPVSNSMTIKAIAIKADMRNSGVATATYTINTAVSGILLSETEKTLVAGKDFTLTATVAPETANNKAITWTSSNEEVATVNNGKVTAVSAGTATITATAADGQGASATCEVTVKYELKYQSNGGAGAAAPEDELHGNEEVIVKDNVNGMTKTCYVFSGWNTKADGTGEDYAVGRQFTMTGNLTLYAKWLPKTYTVTWQVNADEEWSTTTQVLCGDNARPTLPTLPNTVVCTAGGVNKVFMGWVPATVNLSTPVEDITTVTDYFATDATGDALPTITKDITFQGVWAEEVTTPQAAPIRRASGNGTFTQTYGYEGTEPTSWSITDYSYQNTATDMAHHYILPATNSSATTSLITLPHVFAGKTIASDVTITIKHGTHGDAGTYPTGNNAYYPFTFHSTASGSAIGASLVDGYNTMATSKDETTIKYTIAQSNAAAVFSDDLVIKVDRQTYRRIRIYSINVSFNYDATGVTLNPTTLNLKVGESAELEATNHSGVTDGYWEWTPDESDILDVEYTNNYAIITAKAAGYENVTATYWTHQWNGSENVHYTATCTVHVTEASSTEPDPEDPPTPTTTYTNYTTQCSEKTWTVTFMNDITKVGEVTVIHGQTIADTDIPTGLTACEEYTFWGWTTDRDNPTNFAVNTAITEDITLYAIWAKTEASNKFKLINGEDIVAGKNYVIATYRTKTTAGNTTYTWTAMQASETTGNRGQRYLNRVDVTQDNNAPTLTNEITVTDPKLIWKIQTKDSGYTLYNETTGKYAKISGSGSYNLILSDQAQEITRTYYARVDRPNDVDFTALNRQIAYSSTDKVWYAAAKNEYYNYLYKQQEETTLTTSPRCGAKLAAIGNVQVVSGAGITIQGTQEITITGTQLATSTNLRVNNVSNSHFAVVWTSGTATGTNNLPITPTDGNVTATFAVTYTPTTDNYNTTEECEITILAGSQSADLEHNEAMTKVKVYGYCLPERFAIVGEADGQTFALPNNMKAANTYMGIPVTFAEEGYTLENAPAEVVYTAGEASTTTIDNYNTITDKVNRLKLLNGGTAALWEGTTGIKNAQLGDGLKSVVTMWKVTTIDEFQTFNIVDKDGTALSIATGNTSYMGRFGQYTSGASQNLQIVPIAEPTCQFYPTPAVKVTNVTYNSATFAVTKPAGYPQYASTWQYTFTPENTESWTTLTDLTINDLESETDYTIYIKAATTDVVCEDNIASCDFRTLPAPLAACEGAPNNLRATVGPNTAHLEWNANGNNGKIFHIQIWSDELRQEPLGEELTTEAGVTSKDVSGLIEGKEYWWQVYVTAANGDKCASTVASFITNNNAFDIVEWKEDAVVIEPWIDGVVTAAIEQKETGQTAQAAEELFFSKYFEAMSNVKLLGLYNGTNADIDLDGYVVKIARRGSKNPPQSADWADLVDLGSKQETLETGKEMILISYHMTDATDLDLIKCAQENSTSGFSNYIVCGQTIDFNGDDAIALFKDGEMIDIIGAGDATQGNFVSCQPATTAAFMDSPGGWYCANGDNIETKTVVEQDYALSTNRCLLVRKNTVTSGQTAVESNETDFATLCTEWAGKQIPKNAADGGKNATCEGFDYVGSFDYNEYYSTYTPLGETNLGSNANGDGTYTISIPQLKYEDGKPNKIACTNIRINLMGEGNAVLASQVVKVPIMITPNTNTQPVANNKFVETKIMDGEGNYVPIVESYDVTLIRDRAENSPLKNYEVCKDCDIVILDGGVLQVRADIETEPVSTYYCGEHPEGHAIYLEARDVDVYAGGRIVLDNDVLFNTLTIHALDDEVGTANLQNFLHLTDNDGLHHAKRFTGKRWYYFSLPYDCYIEDVTFLNGNKAEYWKDWYLFTYDGKQRAQYAQNGGFVDDYTNFWQVWEQPYIKAGIGYLLGIEERFETDGTNKHIYRQLNFPMAVGERRNDNTIMQYDVSSNNNANANGNDAKRLENIGAWGAINAEQTRENNVGWNMIGMPYLDYYIPTRGVNGAKELVEHALTNSAVGAELITWKVNNNDLEFTPENISVIRYPVYNVNNDDIDHFTERSTDITLIDENFVMKPFLAYLVQAPGHDGNGDGQINQEDNFVIEFVPAGLMDNIDPSSNAASIRRIYYEDLPQNGAEAMQVNIDLRLTNANGKSGKTVIKLNDWNSDDYEVGKEMTASWGRINQPFLASQQVGGAGQGDRLSIQYLPDSSVVNLPIYYRANQAGELTFSLARFTSFTYLDHLYLFDTQENIHTDLLQFDYTFTTEQGDFATRFYLTAEVNRTPQVVDNLNDSNLGVRISGDKSSLTLYGMPINVMVWIYNAEGKLCYAGQAATSTMQYDIPSAGVYYVRLQTAQAKQTLVTIVK